MVHRPPRGTYEIDRVIPGVGRVRIRTGTHDRRRAQQYEAMLDALPLETVRLLATRQLHIRVVWDAWIAGRTAAMDARLMEPLGAVAATWLSSKAAAAGRSTMRSRELAIRRLLAHEPAARLADLPALARWLREQMIEHPPAFNRSRAALLALVRDHVGRTHQLYAEVAAVSPLKETRVSQRHPCTVAEAREIAATLGEPWGAVWWALCCTGMGPREYWLDGWEVTAEGIAIHGRKRAARERIVPLIVRPPAPVGTEWGLRKAIRRHALKVRIYDARRSYARWLDEAGIPGYRQDAYMGHAPRSMRELYRWGEISAWLAEDGARLRAYVGERAPVRLEASQ